MSSNASAFAFLQSLSVQRIQGDCHCVFAVWCDAMGLSLRFWNLLRRIAMRLSLRFCSLLRCVSMRLSMRFCSMLRYVAMRLSMRFCNLSYSLKNPRTHVNGWPLCCRNYEWVQWLVPVYKSIQHSNSINTVIRYSGMLRVKIVRRRREKFEIWEAQMHF